MNGSRAFDQRLFIACSKKSEGFSLMEVMLTVALLGLSVILGWKYAAQVLMKQKIDGAVHELQMSIRLAAAQARKKGQPCGLNLKPIQELLSWPGELSPCFASSPHAHGEFLDGAIRLTHNFPSILRFSSNGLALDGGTAVFGITGSDYQRCLVMSPPLGVVRLGWYEEYQCIPAPSV